MKPIEKRLDNIERALQSIDKTLALNTQSLAEHIRRTELLEQAQVKHEEELKPLKAHVDQMRGAGKLLVLLSVIATILLVLPLFK